MSDFKASFRAAAAQRGSTAPSKEQIRALKAQKALQASKKDESEASASKVSKVLDQSSAPSGHQSMVQSVTSSQGLVNPSVAGPASKASVTWSAPAAAPSAAAVSKSSALSGPKAALPQGFFADKTADAKARGEKIPDQKDKEEEFKQFQKVMDEQIKELVNKEAEEAEEEAEDRAERDAVEQRMWMHHMKDIRQRKTMEPSADAATADINSEDVHRIELPARKRKAADVLKDLVGDGLGNESSGQDDDGDDLVLDWRAKGV